MPNSLIFLRDCIVLESYDPLKTDTNLEKNKKNLFFFFFFYEYGLNIVILAQEPVILIWLYNSTLY